MESSSIPKNIETSDDRDFEFLREEGLKHIEELSRKLWTDYNTHDPGITFLEVLCYAITDLGNRINLPVRDLITSSKEEKESLADDFPTAKQILTTKPVSENDYRKLFIDIEGVNNAFIRVDTDHTLYSHCLQMDEATEEFRQGILSYNEDLQPNYEKVDEFNFKGLYNIYFEPTHDIQFLPDEERKARIEEITSEIKERYHVNRNLCEDLAEVKEIEELKLLVCGDIELENSANAVEVLVEMLFRIQMHLSPSVERYTLNQFLDENIPVEDIFVGPVLENGFIRDEELNKADIKTEVHLSDLVQIVMETPGVSDIRKLRMAECEDDGEKPADMNLDKWTICFPSDHEKILRLCLDRSIKTMNLFKDVIPVDVDPETIKEKLQDSIRAHQESLQLSYDDIPLEEGSSFETGHFSTVQNDLPQLYGTGGYGLSPSLPEERHAKAKQLKSYLLFFDQVLATYFGHLKNFGQLLSADINNRSYFANEVQNINDFEDLVSNSAIYADEVEGILDELDDFDERKNAFLDHLLSRFAENMNEYAFSMLEGFGEEVSSATLWHKSTLLKEYPEVSAERSSAFNYYGEDGEVWDTYNVSGLQHRLARLLGIRDYTRRDLTTYDYEFYQEEDEDDISEWRWRIRDTSGEIMFSSSKHYHSKTEAEEEMWITVSLAWDKNNYQLLPTESGDKYYFNLVNEHKEVVARHIQYYASREAAEADIEKFSEYMFDKISDEGMFLFEHILFRPDRDDPDADQKFMDICMDSDCRQCKPGDPYSLRMTIVLPGWTKRFSNVYFREFAENLIRREVPAHIVTRICWIGNEKKIESESDEPEDGQMTQLEELYKKWLTKKMQSPEDQKDNEFLKPLVDLLHELETVYPAGTLHDCSTSGDSSTSIILGRSTIGELKKQEENGDE